MAAELQLRRTMSAPQDQVWQALTDPAALAAWFWPVRFRTTAEVDLRLGGRYRIAGPGAGIGVSGQYQAVEPPRLLAFTWQWDGEAQQTLVTADLTSTGPDTDLLLTHSQFATEADRDNHVQGWSDCLDRLPAWLACRSQ
jgi:uncharacterized protein YndB with AHSA1/START domain